MKLMVLFLAGAAWAQQPATRILVTYHSQTGHTEKLAQAIAKGAASADNVVVTVKRIGDVTDQEIVQAEGIVLGTPVQWSNVSTEGRRFLDRVGAVLWTAKANGEGRTAGAFCTGGGAAMGKEMTRLSILTAFLTMRFIAIGGVDAAGFGTLGAEATTGPDDPGVSDKEVEEARRFGERFARLTRQFRAGR